MSGPGSQAEKAGKKVVRQGLDTDIASAFVKGNHVKEKQCICESPLGNLYLKAVCIHRRVALSSEHEADTFF
jgi:hypothetical protein